MSRFNWEGQVYEYDASSCYDGNSIIVLPDGRRLRVRGWLESMPPKPMSLELIEGYLPGMEPDGTPSYLPGRQPDGYLAGLSQKPRWVLE